MLKALTSPCFVVRKSVLIFSSLSTVDPAMACSHIWGGTAAVYLEVLHSQIAAAMPSYDT